MKLLTPTLPIVALALALAAASSHAAPVTLDWDFNQAGSTPSATDSSGNGYNGTSAGNVTGTGTAFSGFTSTGSYVRYTWERPFPANVTGDAADLWIQDLSVVTNISNPGNNGVNLIARGGSAMNSGNNGWQVWLGDDNGSGQRTISLSLASWAGNRVTQTSSPVSLSSGTQYQFALTWDYSVSGANYNYAYNVYLTAAGSTNVVNVFSGTITMAGGTPTGDTGSNPVNGDNSFVIGGGGAGYYSTDFPSGYFGGEISDVKLYMGTQLTTSELSSMIPVPEPSTWALVAFGLGFIVFRRQRRQA